MLLNPMVAQVELTDGLRDEIVSLFVQTLQGEWPVLPRERSYFLQDGQKEVWFYEDDDSRILFHFVVSEAHSRRYGPWDQDVLMTGSIRLTPNLHVTEPDDDHS